ncbi:hypothetical protein Fot_26245 [Forsythia ovata]|uniref:Uncharacterized protein n=1 Tax=Forsythia ovata TaxID=205694 RepID=A0ABD1UBJ7_9LAMI
MKRKGQVVMTCSECGLRGHNKRYHLRPEAPSDGKLVPNRGNEGISSQPQETRPVYHFMPTLGLDLQGQRKGPASSSLHVVGGHDKGKSILDDIRMEEIDISPMVEELQRLNAGRQLQQ